MATMVTAQQGDAVDLLCWRHYGRTREVTERVLDANPGLAARGVLLPFGLEVEMPDVPAATADVPLVRLWD